MMMIITIILNFTDILLNNRDSKGTRYVQWPWQMISGGLTCCLSVYISKKSLSIYIFWFLNMHLGQRLLIFMALLLVYLSWFNATLRIASKPERAFCCQDVDHTVTGHFYDCLYKPFYKLLHDNRCNLTWIWKSLLGLTE